MASQGGPTTRCLPGCLCTNCTPLRARELESATLEEQRIFWQNIIANRQTNLPRRRHSSPTRRPSPSALSAGFSRSLSMPAPSNPPPPPIDLAELFPPPPTQPLPALAQGLPSMSASSRRRANFDVPDHVSRTVHNLNDALESIQERLEGVGPRRRQCMNEAMKKVIDTYATMLGDVHHVEPAVIPAFTIDQFPQHTFIAASNSEADATVCSICQESFINGDQYVSLRCAHIFHKECFEESLAHGTTNCSLCRASYQ